MFQGFDLKTGPASSRPNLQHKRRPGQEKAIVDVRPAEIGLKVPGPVWPDFNFVHYLRVKI
jgi:hypothetical protein